MTISDINIKPWIEARILDFLNQTQGVKNITEGHAIMDNPETGHGYTIGVTVAQRILDKRNSLPTRRFQSIQDLDGIKGLGIDKINDLIFSFGKPAAEAFHQNLFDGILLENWEVTDYTTHFDEEDAFLEIVDNTTNFTNWIGRKYQDIRQLRGTPAPQAAVENQLVRNSFLETYDTAHYGAIALAFWFYHFDADNWFSFDRMRQACEAYLTYYPGFAFRQELRLFKGLREAKVGAASDSRGTIPVVINYAERAVTIWQAVLND